MNIQRLNGPTSIQRMLPRHFKMMEMKLAGFSHSEIAKTLECSDQNVWVVTNSPLFIAEYNRQMKLQQEDNGLVQTKEAFISKARSILESSSELAANTQVELMASEDDSIRLRASGSILDRALGKEDGKGIGPSLHVVINNADAVLISNTFKESQNGTKQLEEQTDCSITQNPQD